MSNPQLALPGLLAADSSVEWVWRDDFDEVSDVKRYEHTTVMRDEVARALAPRAGAESTSTPRWAAAVTRWPSSSSNPRLASWGSTATRRPSPPQRSGWPQWQTACPWCGRRSRACARSWMHWASSGSTAWWPTSASAHPSSTRPSAE